MEKGFCDGCGKDDCEVTTPGTDYNGDPDGPSYCETCEEEMARGNVFDRLTGQYINYYDNFYEGE